jgi:hypothetical protein
VAAVPEQLEALVDLKITVDPVDLAEAELGQDIIHLVHHQE